MTTNFKAVFSYRRVPFGECITQLKHLLIQFGKGQKNKIEKNTFKCFVGDYLQNQQCYDPAGCPPCPTTKPSCVGLPNGNNSFPGRSKEYVVCAAERTIAMEVCEYDYDPSIRQCGQDMCKYG